MYKVTVDPGHGGYDPGAVGNGMREKDVALTLGLMVWVGLTRRGFDVQLTRRGDYAPGHLEGRITSELMERVVISDEFGSDLFVSIHVNAGGGSGVEVLVCAKGGQAERVAGLILPRLADAGQWPSRGVKSQNVLVLRDTKCPAILTENGFIDFSEDSNKLKGNCFLLGLADAHIKGICEYFGVAY